MKKVFFLAILIVCVVSLVGCHPKKMRPIETPEKEAKPPIEKAITEEPSEKPVKPVQPSEAQEGVLKDIHFQYDKYNLTDEAAGIIAANAEYLMKHPEAKILIEGNCDERGTEEYNLALGEKRALAARDYLVRFGIERSRISIVSYGEERPLDPAGDEEAWAKNRRDHFVMK